MGEEPVATKAALAASEPEIREPWLGSGFNQRPALFQKRGLLDF
jgi:hypothetical protein